jgi:hypothetical protein
MKWAECVRVKSNQSTMYEVDADVNARVLMIEAAAAEVLGVISGSGTETSIADEHELCRGRNLEVSCRSTCSNVPSCVTKICDSSFIIHLLAPVQVRIIRTLQSPITHVYPTSQQDSPS